MARARLVLPVGLAFAIGVTVAASVAVPSPAHASPAAPAAATSIATHLAEIQQRLTRVTGVGQAKPQDVEALTRALIAARATGAEPGHLAALASAVATVLASGALGEESLERLAQDLYAAANHRAQGDHEAGLLAIDIGLLLQEAGADTPTVGSTLTLLQRVFPAAAVPANPDGSSPLDRPAQRPTRRLSVLSRQSS
jgi:hypothetical protein